MMMPMPMHTPRPQATFTRPRLNMVLSSAAIPNVKHKIGPISGLTSMLATTVVLESPTSPVPLSTAAMAVIARKSKVNRDWLSIASWISSTDMRSSIRYCLLLAPWCRLMLGKEVTKL